jgi:hypothetical protein
MTHDPHDPTPPDCFRQSELEAFQTFENQILATVNYYLWRSNSKSAFLYALELYFENGETLLVSSGESSDAIRVISAESLVETAQKLKELHGEALIQRIVANVQPLWNDVIGSVLEGIRLSRQEENGLYSNDAMLLDFGEKQIMLELSEKDGLELGEYD